MDRQERRNRIDKVLRNLSSLKGVTAASVVDSDGLTIAMRNDFDIDADAMSASVQIMSTSASQIGEQVGHGSSNLVISECKNGLILVAPLAKGFTLTVVSDSQAMLGSVRYEMKESIPELVALL